MEIMAGYPRYNKILDTEHWGPLMWALQTQRYELVHQMVTRYDFNMTKELMLGQDSEEGEETTIGHTHPIMPWLIVIDQRNTEGLYILTRQGINHVWTMEGHYKEIFAIIKHIKWFEGLELMIKIPLIRQLFGQLPYLDENRSETFEALVITSQDTTDIDQMSAFNINNIVPHKCFTMNIILHVLNSYDLLEPHTQPYLTALMENALR